MAADAVLDPASLHLVGWTLGSVHRVSAHGVPARTFLIHWNIPRRWSFLGSRASVAQSRVPRGICIATRSPRFEKIRCRVDSSQVAAEGPDLANSDDFDAISETNHFGLLAESQPQ
jgi:hypothetical protein